MIELIEKQKGGWHIKISGDDYFFTGTKLYKGNNLIPVTPNADKGLRWRVNRSWVSYLGLKSILKK